MDGTSQKLRHFQETVEFIKSKMKSKPQLGLVLGSGLGEFIKEIEVEEIIPFNDVPHFVPTTVEGHKGNMILGKVHGKSIIALQGRFHYYEGHSMDLVVYPIRVMALLGVSTVLLTNSAGGLGDGMEAGDFMIIEDHINLFGTNPLMGPNIKDFGPRFPDMTEAYHKKYIDLLKTICTEHKLRHHVGVYGGLSGPTYETPAEVRYLKMIGCHAVGMSTVPETIAANHFGLKVAAISCISNLAAGIAKHKLSHDEVTDTARRVEKDFAKLVKTFIERV